MAEFFNTGLSQQQFLTQYWQKKPLLIKQAFPDFICPLSPDELAGLACESDIESRLVIEHQNWQCLHGPLTDDDFASLPQSHWTLLVQDVDKHVPETAGILEPFRFIPDWRRDDLMVSYAPEHGSVGPHTDGYDVFLLQGLGHRKWQVNTSPEIEPTLLNDCDLKILSQFDPDQEWVLEPGDMLYLPPHFAHHGVAMDDCMTLSIGFRSPTEVELADALVNELMEKGLGQQHYRDPALQAVEFDHEITMDAIKPIKNLLHNLIEQGDAELIASLGKWVTQTKPSLEELAQSDQFEYPEQHELNDRFIEGDSLQHNPYLRFAWSYQQQGQLFIAGESHTIDNKQSLITLTQSSQLSLTDWQVLSQDKQASALLRQGIAEGTWFWQQRD